MRTVNSVMGRVLAAFAVVAAGVLPMRAVELTRGPYLQVGTEDSIRIRWRTDEPTGSVVFYGTSPNALLQITGSLDATTEHEVQLLGLTPRTRYYYSVGTLLESLSDGPDQFFTTSPVRGSQQPMRIWAIGDCGTYKLGTRFRPEFQAEVRDAYLALAQGRPADVWLALGDNAYFNGEDAEYQTQFFDVYPDILRNTVLWPTLGNHETYSVENAGVLPYFDMFTMPTQGEAGGVASGTENYYSFDHGNVHFVSIDSELASNQSPAAMLAWLRADLEANTSDWTVAYWHTPPYSKGSHDSDEETALIWMRERVVPILEQYGVDLVLCGHSHIYERSYLLRGHYGSSDTLTPDMILNPGSGQVEDTGPYVKFTSGPAANQGTVYVVAGSSGWATFRTGRHPAMFADELKTGSLVIDVEGQTLHARFLRETGAIDDHFTLVKSSSPAPLGIHRIDYAAGDVRLEFHSVPGRTYAIEVTSDLLEPQWVEIAPRVRAANFNTHWSFRSGGIDPRQFFRVTEVVNP